MQIHRILIPVKDIDIAVKFYTENLFFKIKTDISKTNKQTSSLHRKVSLISTLSNNNSEIIFSTLINEFAPLFNYQKKLYDSGIPYLHLSVGDIDKEYHRLLNLGIVFSLKPKLIGVEKIAVFEDGCGNHIQIIEII